MTADLRNCHTWYCARSLWPVVTRALYNRKAKTRSRAAACMYGMQVRRYKTVYGQAHEAMRAASRALDQALQLLQAASGGHLAVVITRTFHDSVDNTNDMVIINWTRRAGCLGCARASRDLCIYAAINSNSMVDDWSWSESAAVTTCHV